jgi:hypothetical protein
LRRVEYGTVAKASVEVEFRQPPAAELRTLQHSGPQENEDTEEESR